ncbi:3-hydroxyphenylacetate 6-hydroxylase [Microdochium nivale]|nr:3-hydroxyphenylacetate 6-hydroxylase [Microdochium nivale]
MNVLPNPVAAPQVSAVASAIKGLIPVSFPTASIIITTVLGLAAIFGSPKLRFHTSRSLLSWLDMLLGGSSHTITLPGPSGWPLVGNLFDLQNGHIETLSRWTEKYGHVIRVALGEREAVFINSHKALAQTVVKQGPAYQSRPTFDLYHSDCASGITTVGTTPYGPFLVRTRKALASQMTSRVLPQYSTISRSRVKKFIVDIMDISNGPAMDLGLVMHRYSTGQVCDQLLGLTLDDATIDVIAFNETMIFRQRSLGSPMRDYIALLRMLRKLRESVLGFAGLKQLAFDKEMAEAAEYDAQQADYLPRLVNDLRNRMVAGDDTACILGNILRQGLLNEDELLSISKTGISSGINLGYSHTWLIGYLASRPDLQEQAFQAIREIYDGQVPDPEEFDRVDFVRALHTEGSRVFTPARTGFPRQTFSATSYLNHEIPKDTLVIMNLFAGNHDAAAFDRPDEFLPERWLHGRTGRTDLQGGPDKLGVPHLTYGAGRRSCPGIEMANHSLYGSLVLLVHFFTWERQTLGPMEKKQVFPPFRAARECSPSMDALGDSATPCEIQGIPWSAGVKFTCRDPQGLRAWLGELDEQVAAVPA